MSAMYDEILSQFTDYRSITTFWDDFSIADAFGSGAVKDTFQRVFDEWKDNYKYLTELVMVLNHKIWQFYGEPGKQRRANLYEELWMKAADYAASHLEGEELEYYYRITD